MFNVVAFFDNVTITLYFGALELCMEITLQLRFGLSCHCDVFLLRHNYVIYLFVILTFFMTLELRYVLVRLNYILKLRHKTVIFR